MRKNFLFFITMLVLLASCGRSQLLDSEPPPTEQNTGGATPVLPIAAWINDGIREPRVTGSSATTLEVGWPSIMDAVRYDIYTVSSFGPPIIETKITDTVDTKITMTSGIDKQLRIKAVDSSDVVLDSWVFQGSWNIVIPQYIKGSFSDDFEDGIFNSAYYIRNVAQATESGGYLQLNQNVTDNGPSLRLCYDPEGKRYVRMSVKWFQHRNGEYYSGGMRFGSYQNNNDTVALYNAHDIYAPSRLGTLIDYTEYEPHDYSTSSRPRSDLNAAEYFDAWFTWNVIIDLDEGSFRVIVNGAEFTRFDTPYIFRDKAVFYFDCYGWNTGHYVRIDDLMIESSDTPY